VDGREFQDRPKGNGRPDPQAVPLVVLQPVEFGNPPQIEDHVQVVLGLRHLDDEVGAVGLRPDLAARPQEQRGRLIQAFRREALDIRHAEPHLSVVEAGRNTSYHVSRESASSPARSRGLGAFGNSSGPWLRLPTGAGVG